MRVAERLALKPTERQISYARYLAKKLNVEIPDEILHNRQAISHFIRRLLEEEKTAEEKPEEKAEEEVENEEAVVEYPGYTNIENPIVVAISKREIKKNKGLLERKKGSSGKSLLEELLAFLKAVKARKDERFIYIFSNDRFTPAYIRTVIESFFLKYQWKYVNV